MNEIRPIRTEADYDWALAEVERYFVNEPPLGTAESDRFEILATLIEAYEELNWRIETADPVDAILYAMEIGGRTQSDLAVLLGSRSRASEILRRKRPLTLTMAHKLHSEWHVPAEALVGGTVITTGSGPRRVKSRRSVVSQRAKPASPSRRRK